MRRDNAILWAQFRRVLLGTVVELLHEAGIRVDTGGLELGFHDGSVFRYPSLNAEMRFVGQVVAPLVATPSASEIDTLAASMQTVWPELVSVVRLPMIGAMEVERNHTQMDVDEDVLRIAFDLSAR